jgi:CRISPR system Cascade subunit CasE
MIQLTPDAVRVGMWTAGEKLSHRGADEGYGWHAILRAAFGDWAPKPFRLVQHPRRPLQLLGYTTADEASLRSHAAAFADPSVTAAVNLKSLAVKSMPDSFSSGQHLGFDVRFRPTIRQHIGGDRAKTRERDAFLVAVEKAGPRSGRAEVNRETVYADWLNRQLDAGGARLINTRASALRRSRISRRDQGRRLKSGIEGPDVTFVGTLEVQIPEVFLQFLARGVGRHRSFGFGMLLIKPCEKSDRC